METLSACGIARNVVHKEPLGAKGPEDRLRISPFVNQRRNALA